MKQNAWVWVPSLYFTEGLPYVVVMTLSVIMYKNLGISNTDLALYTSWLYLPWVIKPLWSPLVDMFGTKRRWVVAMQAVLAVALAGVAFTLPTSYFFQATLACLWLMAFSSATHDIAADGFYMLGLEKHEQAFFVGIRSTFYRFAILTGQGLIVMLAGYLEMRYSIATAWALTFGVLAALLCVAFLWHQFALPRPATDVAIPAAQENPLRAFFKIFLLFFQKEKIGIILAFLLTYRLGEAQLVKMASPFLLDERGAGGLALQTTEIGLVYGTIGMVALTLGGILGGIVISKHGLKYWLWAMLLAINLPNSMYVLLAVYLPESLWVVSAAVAVEQFGYGFGFTAYMLYMIYIAEGTHKTAHFAIATGFMALGMMLPGMWSGWLQEMWGYPLFFAWVLLCALPAFACAFFIPLQANFGKKVKQKAR